MDDDIAGRLIPGIMLIGEGGSGMHDSQQLWFYVRGQVVRIEAAARLLTIEPEIAAVADRRLVNIQIDDETSMESHAEGSPATLGMDDISLGDVLAVEGPTVEIMKGRPVLRARWVAREKGGHQA